MNVYLKLQSYFRNDWRVGIFQSLLGYWVFAGVMAGSLLLAPGVYAQRLDPVLRASFLADPLSDDPRDPLLPDPEVERDLSPLELYTLEQDLARLDQEAQALLAAEEVTAEETERAFDLWRREVRLRRLFGLEAELEAIERVGTFAWDAQQSVDILLLTARLREILAELYPTTDEGRLEQIAEIAETLRDTQTLGATYRQLAELAVNRGDRETYRQRLEQLANFHVQWFEYAEAATIYEQLDADAIARNHQAQHQAYLEQLVYSYQQGEYFSQAIEAQTQLLALYRATGQVEKEPALEVAIARNYRTLNQVDPAIEYYRVAYSTAQRLEQYGYSSTVLQDLGELYASLGRFSDAVAMYNLLIRVEQQSYNHYGIMQAYDSLGQLYRDRGDPENALIAFRAGLAFAEQLDYRQDYFQAQIDEIDP